MYSSAYVWAKVLGNMESRLTAAVISTWFDDAEILELTDTKLVLYSPSSFRKDIILRRCTDYIKDAMRDEFQMEVELEVIDDTEIDAYRENQNARGHQCFYSIFHADISLCVESKVTIASVRMVDKRQITEMERAAKAALEDYMVLRIFAKRREITAAGRCCRPA